MILGPKGSQVKFKKISKKGCDFIFFIPKKQLCLQR
jgi:hypothetical protein